MPAKKTRGKKSARRRRQAIKVKAGKPQKSAKFDNARTALARLTALAKGAMVKLPRGRGTRIDVAVNPFGDEANGSVWVEMGPLWLERISTPGGDREIAG